MKKHKKLIIILSTVVIVLLIALLLFLNLGKEKYRLVVVDTYEDNVELFRESSPEISLMENMHLIPNDKVIVDENGLLSLLVDDDKHIGVASSSAIVINATGNTRNGSVVIDLLYGNGTFVIDNALSENDAFEVNTPNASFSVRGTTFSVEYNSETRTSTVAVKEGKVWCKSGEDTVELEAGSITNINDNGIIPENLVNAEDVETIKFSISEYYGGDEFDLRLAFIDYTINGESHTYSSGVPGDLLDEHLYDDGVNIGKNITSWDELSEKSQEVFNNGDIRIVDVENYEQLFGNTLKITDRYGNEVEIPFYNVTVICDVGDYSWTEQWKQYGFEYIANKGDEYLMGMYIKFEIDKKYAKDLIMAYGICEDN